MKVVFSDKAKKFFLKLDTPIQKQIQKFILKLEGMSDPRASGKMLVGNLLGFWRYRVGDYRLLCRIVDKELVITVVEVGHRKEVYDE
ncbi:MULTISPECIES: type II toxin-antitoxin system RelE/ParE family toxin [unclassified Treponema]|jgi:addiction module toxin, relE/stbE family|uniref:type II toxin-antitoxin system RelE family toxin n=1 Tax=unclassified Treponema TaxID=2638727 RepID=UPI00053013E2|nr:MULTISPECIES: type II toxin-antitoxin system RelE/ParE family toxin [unclassified Treponema]AIW88750.1 RelE [Treponema sp. OMZ 838]UTC44694.1 type II toxin-antitoxin system RelE/ParE family toxin [Treponema sp. OMZ 857]UTC49841.1 type II toxin-antitoxin system RelE/ParE family toxin [Treponema sp. OMZ 855]UTC53933.1 type II toxin-antitoxin system RelE/ParE family toxin [Treponema sp. OMZ 803]